MPVNQRNQSLSSHSPVFTQETVSRKPSVIKLLRLLYNSLNILLHLQVSLLLFGSVRFLSAVHTHLHSHTHFTCAVLFPLTSGALFVTLDWHAIHSVGP